MRALIEEHAFFFEQQPLKFRLLQDHSTGGNTAA